MGEIRPHSKEDNELLNSWRNEKKDGDESIGYPCDIVEISCGYDGDSPLIDDKDVCTFYNILWVEWINGVAYRRGVGRVIRTAWESMEKKDVELILG